MNPSIQNPYRISAPIPAFYLKSRHMKPSFFIIFISLIYSAGLAQDNTGYRPTDTFKMFTFSYAEEGKTPIRIVHGEADNNSGTFPIQTERFNNAIIRSLKHGTICIAAT